MYTLPSPAKRAEKQSLPIDLWDVVPYNFADAQANPPEADSMPTLATHCPICGGKHEIVRVAGLKLGNRFKLAGFDEDGESCCSWDGFSYDSQENADAAGAKWTPENVAELNQYQRDEALACEDEHGYFMDYGPVDSDYYD